MIAVRQRWFSLAGFWCAMMHHDAMWPIHGRYRCRRCRRVYSVPWERR